MQQQAPPGAIWVTETTHRLARALFAWKELGTLPVRGRSQAVTGYVLQGRQASRSRFEAVVRQELTRFVGRDPELQRLLDAWGRAQQGQGRGSIGGGRGGVW